MLPVLKLRAADVERCALELAKLNIAVAGLPAVYPAALITWIPAVSGSPLVSWTALNVNVTEDWPAGMII